jgi:hypothetical protein
VKKEHPAGMLADIKKMTGVALKPELLFPAQ